MTKSEKSLPANGGIQRAFRVADYALASASIGYGCCQHSFLWAALGLAGFALAWLNFSSSAWGFVLKRFGARQARVVPPAAGFPLPPATPYVRR